MLKKIHQSGLVYVALVLLAGILILFWQLFLLGYVQAPSDIPAFYDSVMQDAVSEVVRPQNPLLSDHINQFYVWHFLAAEAMQSTGKIPLWNPYFLAGQPLVANAQPALFYPINWLLFWIGPGVVATIRSMFNLFAAGFFTYLFGRALRMSKLSATLAAIAFAFSGTLMVGPSHAYANSLVWLPFMMWAGEKILTRSHMYFWGLIASIGVALSILGGHPESTFHNLFVFGLYLVARLFFLKTTIDIKFKIALSIGLALGMGLLLGAVQWLPFAVWWRQSATLSRSAAWGNDSIFYAKEWLSQLTVLVTLIFPVFFGNPVDYTYRWPLATFQNYLEQSMYIGLIPIAMAVGSLFSRKKRPFAVIIIAILAITMLAVALRFPVFETINHLPILASVNNTRLKWYFSFLAAILAGFGLDLFGLAVASPSDKRKQSLYPFTIVFAVALIIFSYVMAGKYLAQNTAPDSFAHHLFFTIFSLRQWRMTISLLILFIAGGAILYTFWRGHAAHVNRFKTLFVGLTFVELVVLGYGYNTLVPKETIFPAISLTEMLQQDGDTFRISSSPPAFWPNYGAVYGLSHVGGYDLPVYRRYAEIYKAQGGSGYRQIWEPEWPLFDWMNIKYVVSPEIRNIEKLELVFSDDYWVYKNRDVLPRAYMVYEAEVIADEALLLATMTSGDFPFARKVLLEDELPAEEAVFVASEAGGGETAVFQTVQYAEFTNDSVTLDVSTHSPGLLVMSDLYAPGWQALLDDQPVSLHRANYTFRAVFVPAGTHQITFFYQPVDVQIGKALSVSGILFLLIGLLFYGEKISAPCMIKVYE